MEVCCHHDLKLWGRHTTDSLCRGACYRSVLRSIMLCCLRGGVLFYSISWERGSDPINAHEGEGTEEDSEVKIILRCSVCSATHSFNSKITFELSLCFLFQFGGSIDCYYGGSALSGLAYLCSVGNRWGILSKILNRTCVCFTRKKCLAPCKKILSFVYTLYSKVHAICETPSLWLPQSSKGLAWPWTEVEKNFDCLE
jgi:hypothetical protein